MSMTRFLRTVRPPVEFTVFPPHEYIVSGAEGYPIKITYHRPTEETKSQETFPDDVLGWNIDMGALQTTR